MKLVGVINEPPLDPLSWSGTARYFFGALDRAGLLAGAVDARMSKLADMAFRGLNVSTPIEVWKERYHLDVRRFRSFTRIAGRRLRSARLDADGVLQIGAWYCLPDETKLPCFSYHDGNLALRVRSGQIAFGPQHPSVRRALTWETQTYAKLTGIFVMSSWLAQSFINDFGVPSNKVHVVGAGINFDTIPPEVDRSTVAPIFLMVGKDLARKGGAILFQAFSKVRRTIPEAELVLIGPEIASPPDGVRCLGFLSKKNPEHVALLQKAYREAGVYVLPSLYEPFGISLLEAMAYSLPCIAADHCAMPEIVSHRETGLVTKPGDPDALAEAMIEIARSPRAALAMGAAGRQRLMRRFTWDAVAQRIHEATASLTS
jgi:glycosyltransferase involved in cell wall biosynthesis